MKYCKKCGAELAEGISFCEKCGNPVGQASKQGEGKKGKTLLLAILAGLIVVAVGTVGILFGTGVLGDKGNKETVAVNGNNHGELQSSEQAQNSEEAQEGQTSEQSSETVQTAKVSKGELADRAWKAYSAYVEEILPAIDSYKQYLEDREYEYDYDDEEWDDSGYYFPADRCSDYFALFYMDSDDYPELLCGTEDPVLLTYKNGEVSRVYYDGGGAEEVYPDLEYAEYKYVSIPTQGKPYDGPYISYRERQNSLHVTTAYTGALVTRDAFYSLTREGDLKTDWWGEGDGSSYRGENDPEKQRIEYNIVSNGSVKKVTEEEYSKQLAQREGNDNTWIDLEVSADEGNGREAIFEVWYDFANRNHLFSN